MVTPDLRFNCHHGFSSGTVQAGQGKTMAAPDPNADFDSSASFTTSQIQNVGWVWQRDANPANPQDFNWRTAKLIGSCLRCGHPVGYVAERGYSFLESKAASFAPVPLRAWTKEDLPRTVTCSCRKATHQGSAVGCGASYYDCRELKIK